VETLVQILESYGYWLFLGLGFMEFVGVPIASLPLLVAAGALAAGGVLHPAGVVTAAALGGLLADAVWYSLGRWHGQRVVNAACGLSSNPSACIVSVESRLETMGDPFILLAKFVPGAGNLIGPAAGLARRPMPGFLVRDAVALLAWAGAYVALGWIFDDQVTAVIRMATGYARLVIIVGLILVLAALAWRIIKARSHDHSDFLATKDTEPSEPLASP